MKQRIGKLLAAAALVIAPSAHATTHGSAAFTEAEVRKVDKEAGKVTLKHGPIANLEMPPMTMVFRMKDPSMFGDMKTGDKVRFKAEMIAGSITVVEVAKAVK